MQLKKPTWIISLAHNHKQVCIVQVAWKTSQSTAAIKYFPWKEKEDEKASAVSWIRLVKSTRHS